MILENLTECDCTEIKELWGQARKVIGLETNFKQHMELYYKLGYDDLEKRKADPVFMNAYSKIGKQLDEEIGKYYERLLDEVLKDDVAMHKNGKKLSISEIHAALLDAYNGKKVSCYEFFCGWCNAQIPLL